MEMPCVVVAREAGERTRRALAERGVLDHDHEITAADGRLYIPVTDATAVPGEYALVERAVPERETETMPGDLLGFEPSYERLGDIVLIDEPDPERAARIADAVMESNLRARTVLNRASKITGEFRTREWDHLAGNGTETVHREYGCAFALDLETVYFSPRLATERHRVTEQVRDGERFLDMFAGVGPFSVPAATRGAEVVGVDVNPAAVEYLRENSHRNGVADRVSAIEGDVREVAAEYENWADRVVLNLPHSADAFLDTAVCLAGPECVLHYYDIQHEDAPYAAGEAAIREAAAPEYDVAVETRHTVRSYAPHELNVCLDVRLRA